MNEGEEVGSFKCNVCGCPIFYIIFVKGKAFTLCQKCGTISFGEFFLMKEEEEGGSGAQ